MTAALSADQLNFLALHVKRHVFMWQWLFGDSMLRAITNRPTIAIRRADLDDLIERGLMCRGDGVADVYPTQAGRECIA